MSRKGSRGVGFRLLDGVIVGACALLLMKGMAFIGAFAEAPAPVEPEALPAFGRVLAHARTNYVPGDPSVTGSVPDKKEPAPPVPAAAASPPAPTGLPAESQVSPSERAILERLGDRREELQQRSRQMETRERIIQDSEKRLEDRLNALKAIDEKKAAAAASPPPSESATLKALVTMYETMKPKEAARVFDRLPQDVLVPVVKAMNAKKMAEVLAAMTPETAEKLTVALARRDRVGEAEPRVAAATGLPSGELPAIALPARPRAR